MELEKKVDLVPCTPISQRLHHDYNTQPQLDHTQPSIYARFAKIYTQELEKRKQHAIITGHHHHHHHH